MNELFTEDNIASLASRLCEGIVRYANGSTHNGPWTAAVYQALRDEAASRGWTIFPEEKPCRGEYLCDFMLFEEGYGCRIACESQWWWDTDPLHGLSWAFDKLRGVKSDLKLFIFEGNDGNLQSLVKTYLERNAQLSKGETFLALRWSKDHFENSYWTVPKDGIQAEPIEFTSLGILPAEMANFVTDTLGNNLAVRCPECQNSFIISGMLNRKSPRSCPHCGRSSAGFRNQTPYIEAKEQFSV